MRKKLFGSILLVVLLLAIGIVGHETSRVHAFTNNNLIDDGVFDNSSSMSAAQIDSWLNTFPSSCISPNSGFKAADPIGYSPFYPYLDGKYSYGGPVTAGQVVYDAAAAHHINPQVLLTKLQNEEQLVDGSQGCDNWRYTSAVGYACTDSGTNTHSYTYTGADPYAGGAVSTYSLTDNTHLVTPLYYMNGVGVNSITNSCVNANVKAGFSEQVVHAAWLLTTSRHKSEGDTGWAAVSGSWNHCEDNDTCAASYNVPASWACYSGFMTQGNFKTCPTDTQTTYYDGNATIDGQLIHMDTGATAALYVYTPHIQSFDTIFSNYFGSPYAEAYNYSFVGSSAADLMMEPGFKRVGHYIQIRNIGNQTWYADGNVPPGGHAVRLATRNYVNSPFADPNDPAWLGTANQIKMTPAQVNPGDVATFTFNLLGPSQLFSTPYSQYFVPVLDGSGFFYDKNLAWRISNRAGDYAFSSSQNFPTVLYPDQTIMTTIDITNAGYATWYADGSVPAGGHAVRLAAAGYQNSPLSAGADPNWLGTANQVKMTPASVAPGQVATFTFTLHGPLSGMVSHLHFIPVLDGIGFMKDINMFSDITVPTPSTGYSFVSATNPPSSMKVSSIANVSLTLKNTGSVVWSNNSSGVPNFRIMMTQPNYRSSAFYNSADPAWIAPSQIIYSGSQVGLNGTITINFTWKAPATPGTYTEHFAPVLDGYKLLSDSGMAFTVNVTP